MITKMKKYTFLVLASAYEQFLSQLREAGVVHVSIKAEGLAEDADLQESIRQYDQISHTLKQGAPDQLIDEHNAILSKMEQTRQEIKRMQVWGDFSAKQLADLKDAGYTLYYYSCPAKQFSDELGIRVNEAQGRVYFVSVNEPLDNELCNVETLSDKCAADLEKDLDALKGLEVAAKTRIDVWAQTNIEDLKKQLAELQQRIDWQRVTLSTDSAAEGALKLLEGFCPVDNCEALEAMLAGESVYYIAEDPTEEDNTPIKLRNNWFTKLFEPLTGMYGWPDYFEFDPTPILAPFYLLFFSLCMGDAGYGILLIVLGLLIHYNKLKIEMFDGLGPIITALGVGTLVVGFFLGTAFGMDLSTLMPDISYLFLKGQIAGYDVAMVLAIAIGVFHICLAMVVKAICYTKRYGFRAQIGTWGWTLLIVGGISAFIICLALSVPMNVTKIVLIVIAAISALGIFPFNTPGRNPLINVGAGLWDTYNMATGILGDTLSYIRLYALGLAGGMLGGAFNDLGLMIMGGSTAGATWQWIPFILILLIGHVLNLAMSALGAFVHPLRLTFVEYFKNSGYNGKGTLYQPFKK